MSVSSGRRPDVRPRPRLPRGRDFTRGWVFTVRLDAAVRPRERPTSARTWVPVTARPCRRIARPRGRVNGPAALGGQKLGFSL
jgi:hypothetical protein